MGLIDNIRTLFTGNSSKKIDKRGLSLNTIFPDADVYDFASNGFKLRTTDGGMNASGGTYIYMAFAEEPLVASNGIPATAK